MPRRSEILGFARRRQKGNFEHPACPGAGQAPAGCQRFVDDPFDRGLRLGTFRFIAPRQRLLVVRGGLGKQSLVLARQAQSIAPLGRAIMPPQRGPIEGFGLPPEASSL